MRPIFVKNLTNVERFLAGIQRVAQRGAPEACWQLVMGSPGLGKTKTLEWWATQNDDHVYLRAKSGWRLNWALRDLVTELGEMPANRSEKLFEQALRGLAGSGRNVVVDEIEHAMHDTKVIEMLRDISDLTETHIIIGGMTGVDKKLKRYQQIYSRITDVMRFEMCTVKDVHRVCESLAEASSGVPLKIEDDLVNAIHARTEGRLRSVLNAVKEVERHARKGGLKSIAATDMQLSLLTNDGKARTTAKRVA
ncbi:ATP-binding protein [Parvibaculaceae bacterium PLY_AMNH_Bact1]|nr:ATP-binding protein [Parvibaculaceae bacterium PLY_AMNH_Bact1]